MGRGPTVAGRKNAADAQRAKVFTKLIREITVATRAGGSDPATNARLRLAVDKAMSANMPKDTMERAIKRGSGALDGQSMEDVHYEGYAAGGVAVMVDCLTDNSTRTVADVRHAFSRCGGSMGTTGSVAFQFRQVGEIIFDIRADAELEDKIMEVALEAGAEDVLSEDGFTDVLTAAADIHVVKEALQSAGLEPISADVVMRADNVVEVEGDAAASLRDLMSHLDELDDVQAVHHNGRLPVDPEG